MQTSPTLTTDYGHTVSTQEMPKCFPNEYTYGFLASLKSEYPPPLNYILDLSFQPWELLTSQQLHISIL